MYQKFDKFTTKLLNSTIVAILVFVIGAIITGAFLYNILDFEYATDKDYEPLIKTQETIIKDFDNVYTLSNTDIDITDSSIVVYIQGDDCYLKSFFSKSKEHQTTVKVDKTDPLWVSIVILIIISVLGSFIFYLAFIVMLFIIERSLYGIDKITTKFKSL